MNTYIDTYIHALYLPQYIQSALAITSQYTHYMSSICLINDRAEELDLVRYYTSLSIVHDAPKIILAEYGCTKKAFYVAVYYCNINTLQYMRDHDILCKIFKNINITFHVITYIKIKIIPYDHSLEIIKCLTSLGIFDVDAVNFCGDTPLLLLYCNLDMTQYLVESSETTNILACNDEGYNVLHCACINDMCPYDVVEYLVSYSLSIGVATSFINRRCNTGYTPFMYLFNAVYIRPPLDKINCVMQGAVECGINDIINTKDDIGDSILLYMCKWHKFKCRNDYTIEYINTLIDYGIDVNTQDHNGDTALIYCCKRNKSLEYIKSCARYCNINIKNNDGYTALMYAIEHKNNDAIEFLMSCYAK